MAFRVVEFARDQSVECVPSSWLESTKQGLSCYWPPGRDAHKKMKGIPDKNRWNLFKVRILGTEEGYPTYEIGRQHAARAELTSNIDSDHYDDEAAKSRKKKRTKRYLEEAEESNLESEDGAVDNHIDDPFDDNAEGIELPAPPTKFGKGRVYPERLPVRPHKRPVSSPTSSLDCLDVSSLRPAKRPVSSPTSSLDCLDVSSPRPPKQSVNSQEYIPEMDDYSTQVLSRLDRLESSMKRLINLLAKNEPDEVENLETLLPGGKKLATSEDLETFDDRLADRTFRKQMVRILSSKQGGTDLGKICRCIMRSILENGLMSLYSRAGQKGKLRFLDTMLSQVIIKSVKNSSKKATDNEVLFEIGEVLRNAPNHPGGKNFQKKRSVKNKVPLVERSEVSSDSDE